MLSENAMHKCIPYSIVYITPLFPLWPSFISSQAIHELYIVRKKGEMVCRLCFSKPPCCKIFIFKHRVILAVCEVPLKLWMCLQKEEEQEEEAKRGMKERGFWLSEKVGVWMCSEMCLSYTTEKHIYCNQGFVLIYSTLHAAKFFFFCCPCA